MVPTQAAGQASPYPPTHPPTARALSSGISFRPRGGPGPLTWCSRRSISVSARRRPRHWRRPKPKARLGDLVPELLLSSQRWG